ncbi:hypothetical protein BKA70DRAFT_1315447 [Coprinopsis sp. MPI-PUGE-AT-0042]|nr:hypothetical protein BKA70DRAFT_1315447 [Coprinopsis sp. MPI-PUGE-AT-0042]
MLALPSRPHEHPVCQPGFSNSYQHFQSPHESCSASTSSNPTSEAKFTGSLVSKVSSRSSKWLKTALVAILVISALAVVGALVVAGSHPLFQLGVMQDAPSGGSVEEDDAGEHQAGFHATRRAVQPTSDGDAFVRQKVYPIVVFVGLLLVLAAALGLSAWCCRGAFRNPLCCPCYLCACCGEPACLECVGCGLCCEGVDSMGERK